MKQPYECNEEVIHARLIELSLTKMPPEPALYDLSELFKVFADLTRVRILYALAASELCVCDISSMLSLSQSATSHQLRTLRQARLVKYRREGKTIYYSLADEHIQLILNQGLEHVNE